MIRHTDVDMKPGDTMTVTLREHGSLMLVQDASARVILRNKDGYYPTLIITWDASGRKWSMEEVIEKVA